MKKLVFTLIAFLPFLGFGQFNQAIKAGNSSEISKHLSNIVKVNWMGEEENASSLKLTNKFKVFFEECDVDLFRTLHNGESDTGLNYSMGELHCGDDVYDITYYFTTKNGFELVEEFSIEAK